MRAFLIAILISAAAIGQSARDDWRSYGKNFAGWRYSELAEISTANIAQLRPQWIFQTGVNGKQETTPLVFNGMMYITAPSNHAFALDGATGRPVWHYQKQVPAGVNVCCGQVNRGFAAIGEKLFKVNLEATLVALDAKTGRQLWETTIDDIKKGFSATVAPLAVKNLVIVGIAGAEFGMRGFIDAYDANTGKRVWRFNTVAAPGEPGGDTWGGNSWERGGGSTWITGTYDPELNLTYWGTGNPGYQIKGEVSNQSDRHHVRGVISMANSGSPDTAGSQFYICLADLPQLDGGYTTFGKLIRGDDALTKLGKSPVKINPYDPRQEMSRPINRVGLTSIKIVPADSVK